jgi:tetratricopeptide (TPR) repeat protein
LAAVPALRDLRLLVELGRAFNGLGMCYTGLGQLDKAVENFSQALAVARKVGANPAVSNVWNNVGVAYHEAGHFDSAAACYKLAVPSSASPIPSRIRAPTYANASRLAMEVGDFAESERCAALSLVAAREAQSWRLAAAGLLDKADLCIARSEPEWAWPFVREAVRLAGNRWTLLADAGQFARLRKHMLWITGGQEEQEPMTASGPIGRIALNVTETLELKAFDEWIGCVRNGTKCPGTTTRELIDRRLFGVLARLLAVGIRTENIPAPVAGESSAQLVVRLYAPGQEWALPAVDDLLQQGAERWHNA